MNNDRKNMGMGDFLRVFRRALLIQASWSFDRMQTLGFAYAIDPVLKKLYHDPDEYHRRLNEHLEYFNTQPYCASFILGAVMRQEEDHAVGGKSLRDAAAVKSTLAAPLGALGDSFFWGALKPFAAVVAVSALMLGWSWAPVLFLVLFNIWHVSLRFGMLFWGYRSGGDAVALLAIYSFTKMARIFKIISLVVLGGMIGLAPLWIPELRFRPSGAILLQAVAGMSLTLVLIGALRRGGSPLKLMLGLALLCFALAYAGVV